jgi:hypothetical protein
MSDKIDNRIFKTLMMSGINPYEAIANSFKLNGDQRSLSEITNLLTGKDKSKALEKMNPEDFVTAMYDYFGEHFEGGAERMANSFAGTSGIIDSYWDEIKASMGRSYQDRMIGVNQREIDMMEDGLSDHMQNVYSMAGRGMADRSALERQYLIDAHDFVFSDTDMPQIYAENTKSAELLADLRGKYRGALRSNDNIGVENVLTQVQAFASTAFKGSPEMINYLDTQIDHVKEMRDILSDNKGYFDKSLEYQNEMSKGILSLDDKVIGGFASAYGWNDTTKPAEGEDRLPYRSNFGRGVPFGFAYGLPRVPYNDYITRLHEGERVLTAAEARAHDSGNKAPIININNPIVREEQDIYKLAQAFAGELRKAQLIG